MYEKHKNVIIIISPTVLELLIKTCSGVASRAYTMGQSAPLTAKKYVKNRGKRGKNREKNREEEEKSGRFFHFVPPDK